MMGAALDAAAARRLREALDVLASGDLPECPVCFDVPKAAHARILRCCAKIMCKTCIPSCNGLCPFCRQDVSQIVMIGLGTTPGQERAVVQVVGPK